VPEQYRRMVFPRWLMPTTMGRKNLLGFTCGGRPYDSASRIMQDAGTGGGIGFVFTHPVIPGASFSQQNGLPTANVMGLRCRIPGSTDLAIFDAPVKEFIPSLERGPPPAPRDWKYRSFWFANLSNTPAALMTAAVKQKPWFHRLFANTCGWYPWRCANRNIVTRHRQNPFSDAEGTD